MDRREFVEKLLKGGTLAAVAATAVGRVSAASTSPDGDRTKVLTPDGKLVEVDPSAARQVDPPEGPKAARQGIPGRKWVMVIDLANCQGHSKCTRACGKMHFIPPDRQYIPVYNVQDAPKEDPYWMPRPCMHCDSPPCTKVCPVGATFKRTDGVVLIDNTRCIGCRFCIAACPYSARSFNWAAPHTPPAAKKKGYSPEWGFPRRIGTTEKCDFCPDLARQGKLPGCAAGCPMGAIYYGDQNEDAVTNSNGVTLRLSKLLHDRAAFRFMEELGTHPSVYYLPPVNRRFPPPAKKKQS